MKEKGLWLANAEWNLDNLSPFAIILPKKCSSIPMLGREVCLDVSGPHFFQIEKWGFFMP
jgi:hypothetical protein